MSEATPETSPTENAKPADAATAPKRRHAGRVWLIGLGLLALVATAVALVAPRAMEKTLEGHDVHDLITRQTAAELGMPAGYLPLEWEGLQAKSAGLWAKSEGGEKWRELRAHGMVAEASARDIQKRSIRVKSLSVEHLEMAFGKAAVPVLKHPFENPPELLKRDAEDNSQWETEIRRMSIHRADLIWGQEKKGLGGLRDSVIQVERQNEGLYVVHGREGLLKQENWPDLRVMSFDGSYANKTLTISKSRLVVGDKDEVSLTGRVSDGGDLALTFQAKQCSVTPFLPEDSRKKLTGTFTTEARMTRSGHEKGDEEDARKMAARDDKTEKAANARANNKGENRGAKVSKKTEGAADEEDDSRGAEVAGKIAFNSATLRNIDALERAAEFTGISRFRRLELDVLEGSYRYAGERLQVEDFALEAKGLLRMEGSFTVRDKSLSGNFKLGVSEKVLASFPGAEGAVFNQRRGSPYYWAPLHLSGSLQHPNEDLKERLVAAAKAHYAKKFLAPILKPGKFVLEALESLY